jgi:2-dehydropantoate 2-reductase
MRFVVYGAGAIGGVIGARLTQSGQDVVLIARGSHAAALQRRGLRLETPDGADVLMIRTVETPADLDWKPDDLAIMAMKSQDTAAAAQALAQSARPDVAIVSAQNGVSNERVLSRWFDRVYGMCVMCPAAHLEPGVVQAHSMPVTGLLDLGRFPSGADEVAAEVSLALEGATFRSVVRPDIMRWKYRKLVMNLGNAVQALCGPSEWTDDLQAIIELVESEAMACFAAAGIEATSVAEDRSRRGDLLQIRPIGEQPRGGGSTWQSFERRTGSVETDHLNGEIALLGRLHSVPTPANALVQRLATAAAHERRAPGAMTHAELRRRLESVSRPAS